MSREMGTGSSKVRAGLGPKALQKLVRCVTRKPSAVFDTRGAYGQSGAPVIEMLETDTRACGMCKPDSLNRRGPCRSLAPTALPRVHIGHS